MKPLNQSERRKAFLSFLLFFLITIAVVLIAVFSSIRVPIAENEQLRKDRDLAENEMLFLQSFENKMQETMNLLDSFELIKNEYKAEADIKKNLGQMTAMISDSISVNSICNRILDNLTDLHAAKKQLRDVSNQTAVLEEKNHEIERLQARIEVLDNRIIDLLSTPR
jgi:hypothetical protein